MVNPLWENIFKKRPAGSIRHLLSQVPLFAKLTERELRFLEDIVHIRTYRRDEAIFKAGEAGTGMFLLIEGHAQIIDESGQRISLESGDFFGELALIEHERRRTASATALDNCRLVGFFKADLEEIKQRNAVLGVKILDGLALVIARRLRETLKRQDV